jgi:hypothetical protein
MTEAEWLACTDPKPMLEFLGSEASDRKCRLFMVACCRRAWHAFDDEDEAGRQDAIVVAERHADGLASDDELSEAFGDLTDGAPHRTWDCCTNLAVASFDEPGDSTAYAAGAVEEAVYQGFLLAAGYYRDDPGSSSDRFEYDRSEEEKIRRAETAALANLLRDVFGNPFRLISLNPDWITPIVTDLATAAYEERSLPSGELDLARLTVLADALEEAGCDNADILNHLRERGTHVRGCWPVDLLLDR